MRHSGRVLVALSVVLYVVALFLPALEFADQDSVMGYTALAWGWWGVLTGDFPWFANLAYLAGMFFLWRGKKRVSVILTGSACALALLALWVDEWWFNEGSATPVEDLGPAFYVWMASFVVLFVAALLMSRRHDTAAGPKDDEE